MTDFYYYVKRIEDDDYFTLARYGDGEWGCIFGETGQTCDGHQYFADLSLELQRTVLEGHDYPYHYGMVKIARKVYNDKIDAYILRNSAHANWCDGTVLVDASRAGKLFPLIHALRYKNFLYVGPAHLRKLNTIGIPYEYFIEVPAVDSWLRRDTISAMIRAAIKTLSPDVIGFSAGPTTEVLMHDLYEKYGDSLTMIDFGSLFDGFLGKYSRKYMKTQQWKKLRKKNLGL